MIKQQYIEILKIRGIKELEIGVTINKAIQNSGGDPTDCEMIKANENAMFHFLEKFTATEKHNDYLISSIKKIKSIADHCLPQQNTDL